jgi:hypothetical protein
MEMEPDIWTGTYYSRVLFLIKAQALFEPGAGFYFTETPAWGIKAMLSSHGTWAALRHDTILYVKQVYAERAGDGDYAPTYRTEPIPAPVHYIEPNMMFFEGALASMTLLREIGRDYDLMNDDWSRITGNWISLLERSYRIVKLEYQDKPVNDLDVSWIKTIPREMRFLVLPPEAGYDSYSEGEDEFKGAIIADVFTNAEFDVALEVGNGIPYRIYVPLNDGQGGKRIAVGYTFSYYEFLVPLNQRMTDDEWREMVYSSSPDVDEYLPFWAEGITLPPK